MLRVLGSRDYRLFWSGSFIANLGVWMQQIALGWLVYDLTRRASLLGTDTTIQTVVHDGMRGRVMSMMTVILFGFATAGALRIGFVGDRIGVPRALAGGGVVIALVASVVLGRAPTPARAAQDALTSTGGGRH